MSSNLTASASFNKFVWCNPMKSVWLLQHAHEFEDGHEDVKLIGVFTSEQEARDALAQVTSQPGFREHPEGFSIDEYKLGEIAWKEGFISWDEALQPTHD